MERYGVIKRVVEVAAWTLAGTLFWLATASSVTAAEAIAAAAVALPAGALATVARRAMPFRALPRRVWPRWAATVPVAAVADMVRLTGWLRTRQPGQLRAGHMPGGDGARETGWRAGGIVALSATPGSVVVASDPEAGTVTVHSLVHGWPGLDEDVLRSGEEG